MIHTFTANGNQNVPIPRGHRFSVATSGSFTTEVVKAQYAKSAAAAATLSTNLAGDDNDLVFTARKGGADGNAITVEYIAEPGNPVLSVGCDNGSITVNLATDSDEFATLETALTGANNDLILTAVAPGTGGNAITIALIDPAGNDAALGVVVTGTDIVVNLATGVAGAITSRAREIRAALEADVDAAALVSIRYPAGTDGSGVVTALAEASLAGGTNGEDTINTTAAEIATAIAGNSGAANLVTVANKAGNDGTGLVIALAETALAGGTNGTFSDIEGGSTGDFNAATERELRNVGATDYINLNMTSYVANITVIVNDLGI